MSFSIQITGTPKAVAAALRAEAVKFADHTGDEISKTAIAAVFESAALAALSVRNKDWNGRERNVAINLVGHIGDDGGSNVSLDLKAYGVAEEVT